MEIKINTGNSRVVKFGFLKTIEVVYCGMPNENVFVLAPLKGRAGYQGFSPNIFYAKNSKSIHFMNNTLEVKQVTPDHIVLGINR